jgi:hypothetical protein
MPTKMSRSELEHHRRQPHALDARAHGTPLVGKLPQCRADEHSDALIRRADHGWHPSHDLIMSCGRPRR